MHFHLFRGQLQNSLTPKTVPHRLDFSFHLLHSRSISVRNTSQRAGLHSCRSPEQSGLPTEEGGVLKPGHYQITIGERHQYSYQHFVGDVYQEQRAQAGNEVENRINLVTTNLTYQ